MTELNERLLADAGGWQAMKEARALHEMDRVIEATWQPPMLEVWHPGNHWHGQAPAEVFADLEADGNARVAEQAQNDRIAASR